MNVFAQTLNKNSHTRYMNNIPKYTETLTLTDPYNALLIAKNKPIPYTMQMQQLFLNDSTCI